ncbi:hypothetical protein F5877DRAFT_86966 [Lentinula edodes]|nr:hypothetical protein F5877DRAFT_86966 [Lentinula edodes]
MSDGQQQRGEEPPFSPALPPAGSTTEQAARLAHDTLQTITDRVTERRLSPDAGRNSMRTYLETVFRTFQLGAEYSLGDSLRPWLEIIDNHEQRLAHAEREGRRRQPRQAGNSQQDGNQVRLPGIEALLAGPTHSATRGEPQGRDGRGRQQRSGSVIPPPLPRWSRGEDDARQARPEEPLNNRARFEEEDPRREARAQSARRSYRYSSEEEDESDDERRREKRAKRAKQDKGRFNWTADAFIKQSVLSPKHRKVIEEIENFKLDLDEAVESIEQSGVNPIFPKKLWKSVLRDEYIELAEVHALVATYHHPEAPRPASNNTHKSHY